MITSSRISLLEVPRELQFGSWCCVRVGHVWLTYGMALLRQSPFARMPSTLLPCLQSHLHRQFGRKFLVLASNGNRHVDFGFNLKIGFDREDRGRRETAGACACGVQSFKFEHSAGR